MNSLKVGCLHIPRFYTEIIGLIIYLLTELIYNEHYGRKLKLVHLFSYSNVVPK